MLEISNKMGDWEDLMKFVWQNLCRYLYTNKLMQEKRVYLVLYKIQWMHLSLLALRTSFCECLKYTYFIWKFWVKFIIKWFNKKSNLSFIISSYHYGIKNMPTKYQNTDQLKSGVTRQKYPSILSKSYVF